MEKLSFEVFKKSKLKYLEEHLNQSRVDKGIIPLLEIINKKKLLSIFYIFAYVTSF